MPLEPPTEQRFASRAIAQQHAQQWAKQQGYALVVAASAKKGKFVYLACDKAGAYRNSHKLKPEERQRRSSSSKEGCTFRLRLRAMDDGDWELKVVNGAHCNHEPSASALAHPVQRRIDVGSKHQIFELARHGTTPKQIAALLLQREENPLATTPKDITNLLAQNRRELLDGRSPTEALVEWLREQDWPHVAKATAVSENVDRLQSLFFAHPRGLHLLRRFGTVTLIDATYNTNQHRLPLPHFVGMTSSNRSFTIALAFLTDESALTYQWALQALKGFELDWAPDVVVTDDDAALAAALHNVFRGQDVAHIHCQWHVRQNVEKYARPRLVDDDKFNLFMSDFDELRYARTIAELDSARDDIEARWGELHPALVEYIDQKL